MAAPLAKGQSLLSEPLDNSRDHFGKVGWHILLHSPQAQVTFQAGENLVWVFCLCVSLEKHDPVISRNPGNLLCPQGRRVVVHETGDPCDATEVVPVIISGLIRNFCLGQRVRIDPLLWWFDLSLIQ